MAGTIKLLMGLWNKYLGIREFVPGIGKEEESPKGMQ